MQNLTIASELSRRAVCVAISAVTFCFAIRSTLAHADEFDSFRIRGIVTDADAQPLVGAKVTLNRFEGARLVENNKWDATTDKDGRYELTLRVVKGQTPTIREIFADLKGYIRAAPPLELTLKVGEEATVDFRLEKGVLLGGHLKLPLLPGEEKRPPGSIRRRYVEVSSPDFDQLTVNARIHLVGTDGMFEIYVPPGIYTLRMVNYMSNGELPEWKDLKAPSDDLSLELQPFEWNEANLGKAFDNLWNAMDHSYSYFFLKPDVDWQALRDAHRSQVARAQNPAELADALREMLAPLKDMHVWIETPDGVVPTIKGGYIYNGNREITVGELQNIVPCGKFALVGKTKRDGFGYFLMQRQSKATADDVQSAVAAIRKLKDTPGFIVDLRVANGGSEPLALEIARLFCEQPTVYAKSKYRNGAAHDAFGQVHERILSATDDAYTRPVVCLIGSGAVSSGEGFVKMMKCLPQVTTVGLPTRGASGNPKPFALSRTGVTVYFSRWVDMLPDGQPIEGVGIQPDTRVEAPETSYAAADPTLEKGLEVLRAKVAETRP
jgi:hypothetical protein